MSQIMTYFRGLHQIKACKYSFKKKISRTFFTSDSLLGSKRMLLCCNLNEIEWVVYHFKRNMIRMHYFLIYVRDFKHSRIIFLMTQIINFRWWITCGHMTAMLLDDRPLGGKTFRRNNFVEKFLSKAFRRKVFRRKIISSKSTLPTECFVEW